MASLIPGYEYDIFISYRQKDNKGDRWVSEFVVALKTELESTFKEDISVYFDVNPHDGLLETHDVDASLKEKLKCLIFIPIISRTYCDPNSFAWNHEFKPFIELASGDQFGSKVKLPGGNVASRVLPIRIHDLEITDIKLCESILGGVLRGIEFIYKEPGVNKPLTSGDDEKKNLNNTKYRIQINKVANAIDEIIRGLKSYQIAPVKEGTQQPGTPEEVKADEKLTGKDKPASFYNHKWLSGVSMLVLIVVAAVLAYPKIFKQDKLEKLRSSVGKISIAVMPFQNMTNDTVWNVWQDGIQNEIINNLTNTEELKVRQIESITGLLQSKGLTNYASITPAVASSISQKLDANVFIYGTIKQAGPTTRVSAQLIDSKTEEVFKSFQIDGTTDNILHIIDSLSIEVKNFLIISKLEKQVTPDFQLYVSTKSPEAYKYFIHGKNAFMKRDYSTARDYLLKAVALDSNFVFAAVQIAFTYGNQFNYDDAKKWALKLYAKKDQMPMLLKNLVNYTYAAYFETPFEEIKYLKQFLDFDNQSPINYWSIGNAYNHLSQYDKAIPEFEKAIEIWNLWGSKPAWVYGYTALGYAYQNTGNFTKEKELYKKAEKDFPDDPDLIFMQAVLSLSEGDTIESNLFIKKYKSILKDNSSSEADIILRLAWIYSEAKSLDKAEKYFRQALALEPDKPDKLNNLVWFLIDRDRNLNEGLKLVDKALSKDHDNTVYLDTKGWGLFKQGKYEEALKLLEKGWNLKAIYNHDLYLHIEEVKKAIAGQK